MGVLREIWGGTVLGREFLPEDYRAARRAYIEADERFRARLSEDADALYEECIDLDGRKNSLYMEHVFEEGFKLGARVMLAALEDDLPRRS